MMVDYNENVKEVTWVIDNFCKLEWYRGGAHENTEDQLKYPPIILWRFKEPESELAEKVAEIVLNAVYVFQGRVRWDIAFLGRNWVLNPIEFTQFYDEGEYRKDVHAIADFVKLKPEVGRLANFDVPDLAKHIENELKKYI